jgi:hypothetical protein
MGIFLFWVYLTHRNNLDVSKKSPIHTNDHEMNRTFNLSLPDIPDKQNSESKIQTQRSPMQPLWGRFTVKDSYEKQSAYSGAGSKKLFSKGKNTNADNFI